MSFKSWMNLPPPKTRYRTFPSPQEVSSFQCIPSPGPAVNSVWLLIITIVWLCYFLDFTKIESCCMDLFLCVWGGRSGFFCSVWDFLLSSKLLCISAHSLFCNCWAVFHCIWINTYISWSAYPPPFWQKLDCFRALTIMNKAGMNILVQVLLWSYAFIFLG